MVRLLEDIYITIDTRLDSVLICDLGRAEKRIYSRMTFIGRERPMTPNDVIII